MYTQKAALRYCDRVGINNEEDRMMMVMIKRRLRVWSWRGEKSRSKSRYRVADLMGGTSH